MDKGELARREVHHDDRRVESASLDYASMAWTCRYRSSRGAGSTMEGFKCF